MVLIATTSVALESIGVVSFKNDREACYLSSMGECHQYPISQCNEMLDSGHCKKSAAAKLLKNGVCDGHSVFIPDSSPGCQAMFEGGGPARLLEGLDNAGIVEDWSGIGIQSNVGLFGVRWMKNEIEEGEEEGDHSFSLSHFDLRISASMGTTISLPVPTTRTT